MPLEEGPAVGAAAADRNNFAPAGDDPNAVAILAPRRTMAATEGGDLAVTGAMRRCRLQSGIVGLSCGSIRSASPVIPASIATSFQILIRCLLLSLSLPLYFRAPKALKMFFSKISKSSRVQSLTF